MARIYLFLTENRADMSSDEKVKAIADAYFKRIGITDSPSGEALLIAREEKGKPYFPKLPYVHFSVSHSGKYFACAMSDIPVGLDIQEHTRRKNESEADADARRMKIAKRFFHPDENEYASCGPAVRFFKVWTAKESYVKLTGKGIDADFSGFNVFDLDEKFYSFERGEYSISICSADEAEVEVIDLPLEL